MCEIISKIRGKLGLAVQEIEPNYDFCGEMLADCFCGDGVRKRGFDDDYHRTDFRMLEFIQTAVIEKLNDKEFVAEFVKREFDITEKESKGDDLPDGLQTYIDGVALNILYSNYPKSINGIWSRAEVDEHLPHDDGDGEFWMVNVDFGCQDDTRNEQYRERITVNKDKDGKWTMLGLTYPNVIDGVEGSNFCDCGNTYEWVCKHECPNDRPSTAHPKYKEKV